MFQATQTLPFTRLVISVTHTQKEKERERKKGKDLPLKPPTTLPPSSLLRYHHFCTHIRINRHTRTLPSQIIFHNLLVFIFSLVPQPLPPHLTTLPVIPSWSAIHHHIYLLPSQPMIYVKLHLLKYRKFNTPNLLSAPAFY